MTEPSWKFPSLQHDLAFIAAAGLCTAALIGAATTTGVILLVRRSRNG